MMIRVLHADTLEDLEREVAVLKTMGWMLTGEGVPFWQNGQHCLELERPEDLEEIPETHWIAGFTGEEYPSLNELSELHDEDPPSI